MAESAVKSTKTLLKKSKNFEDFKLRLAEFRNTPRETGYSPTQLLFGRRVRGVLPALPTAYESIDRVITGSSQDRELISKQDMPTPSKTLNPLAVGTRVRVQDPISKVWDSKGVIEKVSTTGRSYVVDIDGKFYRRNRIFLRIDKSKNRNQED